MDHILEILLATLKALPTIIIALAGVLVALQQVLASIKVSLARNAQDTVTAVNVARGAVEEARRDMAANTQITQSIKADVAEVHKQGNSVREEQTARLLAVALEKIEAMTHKIGMLEGRYPGGSGRTP